MGCSHQLATEDLNHMDELERLLKEKNKYIKTLQEHNEPPNGDDKAKITGYDIEITHHMEELNKKFAEKGNKKQKKKYVKLLDKYNESLNLWRKYNGDSEEEEQIQRDYDNAEQIGSEEEEIEKKDDIYHFDDYSDNNNEDNNHYDGFYNEDGKYPYLEEEI